MEIYKLTPQGKKLPKEIKNKSFYLKEQKTAEAVANFLSKVIGKDLKWKAEIVYVMSHDEAFNQLEKAIDTFSEN